MNESENEEKLCQHGFTRKEIALLRTIAIREKETYLSLLMDLKSRFIRACVFLPFINSLLLLQCLSDDDPGFFIVVAIFFSVLACVFAPLKLGLKAFTFLRKNRSSSQ
ncbi:hypothetical protein PT300_02445 [Enterobacteriaceae bacterium ESL0689]|nr:hypothetical protein [Enterobacteriaceae bacterium ESL0689]